MQIFLISLLESPFKTSAVIKPNEKSQRGLSPIEYAVGEGANLLIVLLNAMELAWPDLDCTLVSLRAIAHCME